MGETSMIYELRTYWAAPDKADALHQRFREHTCRLFAKHGMTMVAFWSPVGGRDLHGDLVYVMAYASQAARDVAWDAFRADPEWQQTKAASEVDGVLAERVDSVMLNATDYSPLQ
jgi:hypothetical protein